MDAIEDMFIDVIERYGDKATFKLNDGLTWRIVGAKPKNELETLLNMLEI